MVGLGWVTGALCSEVPDPGLGHGCALRGGCWSLQERSTPCPCPCAFLLPRAGLRRLRGRGLPAALRRLRPRLPRGVRRPARRARPRRLAVRGLQARAGCRRRRRAPAQGGRGRGGEQRRRQRSRLQAGGKGRRELGCWLCGGSAGSPAQLHASTQCATLTCTIPIPPVPPQPGSKTALLAAQRRLEAARRSLRTGVRAGHAPSRPMPACCALPWPSAASPASRQPGAFRPHPLLPLSSPTAELALEQHQEETAAGPPDTPPEQRSGRRQGARAATRAAAGRPGGTSFDPTVRCACCGCCSAAGRGRGEGRMGSAPALSSRRCLAPPAPAPSPIPSHAPCLRPAFSHPLPPWAQVRNLELGAARIEGFHHAVKVGGWVGGWMRWQGRRAAWLASSGWPGSGQQAGWQRHAAASTPAPCHAANTRCTPPHLAGARPGRRRPGRHGGGGSGGGGAAPGQRQARGQGGRAPGCQGRAPTGRRLRLGWVMPWALLQGWQGGSGGGAGPARALAPPTVPLFSQRSTRPAPHPPATPGRLLHHGWRRLQRRGLCGRAGGGGGRR